MQELNKSMNVQRQRRKEEAQRQEYARQASAKTNKCDNVLQERENLKQARQNASLEAGRARAKIKEAINRMRAGNSFSEGGTNAVKNQIQEILLGKTFNPAIRFDAVSKFAASKPRPQKSEKEAATGYGQPKELYSADKQDVRF